MSENDQTGLFTRAINLIKNAHDAKMEEGLRHSIKRELSIADNANNRNGITEISDISDYTINNLKKLVGRFSAYDSMKALDDVVKIETPGKPMLSDTISPRINITEEALKQVQEIISGINRPDTTPSNSALQASKAEKPKSRSM